MYRTTCACINIVFINDVTSPCLAFTLVNRNRNPDCFFICFIIVDVQ